MGEQLNELPEGFMWAECEAINARVPMPEGWHFLAESHSGTRAFFMSREQIRPGQEYETGLSLQAFARISRAAHTLPTLFARRLIEEPKAGVLPSGELEVVENGPLATYRRQYDYSGGFAGSRLVEPMHFYWSATGNDRRDIAYLANFETRAANWEQFQDVARIMVEGIVLDPRMR